MQEVVEEKVNGKMKAEEARERAEMYRMEAEKARERVR